MESNIAPSSSNKECNALINKFKDLLKSSCIDKLISYSSDNENDENNMERIILEEIKKILHLELDDREKLSFLTIWLNFVGLNAQYISYIEQFSITDISSLLKVTHNELRFILDSGKFDCDIKQKLLQSTLILQSHCLENIRSPVDEVPSTSGFSAPSSTSIFANINIGRVVQSASMNFSQKSPIASSRLVHAIPHSWHRSTKFRFSGDSVCHFCQRPLGFGFLNAWEKCRSCKWKVHTQCKNRVGDSCGLTPDHLRFLFDKLIEENNGGMWKDPQSAVPLPGSRSMNDSAFQYPEGPVDSSSSTNSSAPSTPAATLGVTLGPTNPLAASYKCDRNFLFPESDSQPNRSPVPILVISEGETQVEQKVDAIESEGTIVNANDSIENNETRISDLTANDKFNKKNATGHTWERNTWNMSTIRGPNVQASWNEVTIQFDAIEFDKYAPFIGRGRFGKVLRGYHYGDVAVKMLNMDHVEDKSKKIDEFKLDVSAYKNTRHDNIALFLGYFMNENNFGIVTNLVKGQSLHVIIHVLRENIDPLTGRHIAQQICQGMSYLHTKKILHKDLRTKNVLIEGKNKVVITDFGILSMKRLCYPKRKNGYVVPKNWLSYVSPEISKSILCDFDEVYGEDLPFSEYSDVFAFGTVWYELLTGSIPFLEYNDADTILWLKGYGVNGCWRNTNTALDPKIQQVLMSCWNSNPNDRPTFADVSSMLSNLPKKGHKTSTFPVLMKSYESTF